MLVSVKSTAEAAIVAATDGVGIVDIKDPSQGSLGFAGAAVINDIAAKIVLDEKLLSVALGELDEIDYDEVSRIDWSHVEFVKIGLNGLYENSRWRLELRRALAHVPKRVQRVLVLYVDQVDASDAINMFQSAQEDGLSVVLLDTFDKTLGNTFAHWSDDSVRDVFQSAARRSLITVLAGSIGMADLPKAFQTGADLIGVRGAVCNSDRRSSLSKQRLDSLIAAYHEVRI